MPVTVTSLRCAAAAVAAVVVLAGCPGPVGEEEVIDRTVPRQLKLDVKGDRVASYQGPVTVHAVSRKGRRESLQESVVGFEVVEFIRLDNVSIGFEVGVAGMYKGDGRYTLPRGIPANNRPTTGPTVEAGTTDGSIGLSHVSVLFYDGPADKPTSEQRFGYLLERCQLRLDDDATKGEAHCPGLAAVNGQRVTVDASWQ